MRRALYDGKRLWSDHNRHTLREKVADRRTLRLQLYNVREIRDHSDLVLATGNLARDIADLGRGSGVRRGDELLSEAGPRLISEHRCERNEILGTGAAQGDVVHYHLVLPGRVCKLVESLR